MSTITDDNLQFQDEVNVGDVLGNRYVLLELVGRGGCGLVFLAKDNSQNREVAVKILAGEGVKQKDTLQKFEQEGQILRRLHAQNTVFFYDYGETPQHLPYIVMEFIRGTSLKDVLEKDGRLPVGRTVSILIQVFTSLAEAHGYGFVHRDLKPGNIMLCEHPGTSEDYVKVLDFGIAKVMGEDEAIDINAENVEDMAGTPKYMPPEQFKNASLTPAADLYSMGCIAYEMLCGYSPFDGDTLHVTVAKHLFMIPPSLHMEVDPYPNVAAIVFKLLEKNPTDRFGSAEKVIEALKHWEEPELIPALQGCRIHGDDNEKTNTFYETECAATMPLEVNSAFMAQLANLPVSGPTPSMPSMPAMPAAGSISGQNSSVSGQIAAPVRRKNPMMKIYVVLGLIILVLIAAVVIVMIKTKAEPAPEPQVIEQPVVEEPAVKITRTMIEDTVDALSAGAITSTAFGVLSNGDIIKPVDIMMPADGITVEEVVVKKGKKQPAPAPFEFTLNVTPKSARVVPSKAKAECSDGVCKIQTASATENASILLIAEDHKPLNLLISKPIVSATVALEHK